MPRPRARLRKAGGGLSRPAAVPFFPSGCTLLDCVNGGGWAEGKLINIVGDSATGKTLLAEEAVANFARKYKAAYIRYVEAESRFDRRYAHTLGIPMDRVDLVEDVPTVEELFRRLTTWIDASDRPSLVVVDSLDSLTDEAEEGREIDKGSYGQNKAKKLSELFRRLCRRLAASNTTVIIVSQVRMKMDVAFGSPYNRAGGKALDFYATQIIWLHNRGRIYKTKKKIKRAIGSKIEAKNTKNSAGRPFRSCEFPLIFEFGVEDVEANLTFLKSSGYAHLLNEDIDSLLRRAPKMSGEEWRRIQKKSARAVRKAWRQIEEDFTPGRSKY